MHFLEFSDLFLLPQLSTFAIVMLKMYEKYCMIILRISYFIILHTIHHFTPINIENKKLLKLYLLDVIQIHYPDENMHHFMHALHDAILARLSILPVPTITNLHGKIYLSSK